MKAKQLLEQIKNFKPWYNELVFRINGKSVNVYDDYWSNYFGFINITNKTILINLATYCYDFRKSEDCIRFENFIEIIKQNKDYEIEIKTYQEDKLLDFYEIKCYKEDNRFFKCGLKNTEPCSNCLTNKNCERCFETRFIKKKIPKSKVINKIVVVDIITKKDKIWITKPIKQRLLSGMATASTHIKNISISSLLKTLRKR